MPSGGPGNGPRVGAIGPGGCPVLVMKALITSTDPASGAVTLMASGKKNVLQVDAKTKYRIPGVAKKDAGLAKIADDAEAKVTYCATDGKIFEIKVLKAKTT